MCTSFTIGDKDSGLVYARTMEFTLDLCSQLMVIPAGSKLTGTDRHGQIGIGGLEWEAKHAVVAANALGLAMAVDGVNAKGLVFGGLNFPASAHYLDVAEEDQSRSIASFEIGTYLLTTCATVEEVKQALTRVPVQGVKLAAYGGNVPPLHYTVHDADGGSIVIEYTNGKLDIDDNPTTVMTNEPAFPMHLQNLAQYQYVTNHAPSPIEVNGLTLAAPSSGDGVNGLTAGFIATSRFVRAFWFRQFALAFDTPAEGVQIARHLLNQFDIPPGTVLTQAGGSGEGGGVAGAEITQWMTVIDQRNAVIYASTYDHPNLCKVDVARAAAADGIEFLPLPAMENIPELLPAGWVPPQVMALSVAARRPEGPGTRRR
jgi:choloylglycine hydrolase